MPHTTTMLAPGPVEACVGPHRVAVPTLAVAASPLANATNALLLGCILLGFTGDVGSQSIDTNG